MSRKIIAIDIDDVIADSTESVRVQVNKLTGASLLKGHYRVPGSYSKYYEQVWERNGLDKITFDDIHTNMTEDQFHVEVVNGALVALERLSYKFNLVLITSRDFGWEKATNSWLNKKFGFIFKEVIFSSNPKYGDDTSKGALCNSVDAKWLIDDRIEYCQSAVDSGVNAILFGQYGWHNQDISKQITRCKDWQEIMEFFNGKS